MILLDINHFLFVLVRGSDSKCIFEVLELCHAVVGSNYGQKSVAQIFMYQLVEVMTILDRPGGRWTGEF